MKQEKYNYIFIIIIINRKTTKNKSGHYDNCRRQNFMQMSTSLFVAPSFFKKLVCKVGRKPLYNRKCRALSYYTKKNIICSIQIIFFIKNLIYAINFYNSLHRFSFYLLNNLFAKFSMTVLLALVHIRSNLHKFLALFLI